MAAVRVHDTGTPSWRRVRRFAAAAALLGGALRVGTSFLTWDSGVGWLEALALVTDVGLLFGLMGVFLDTHEQIGVWGLLTFAAAEAGIASIIGPDTVAFGIDTYQVGVVVISVALFLFSLELRRRRAGPPLATGLWMASTVTAVAAGAAGRREFGFVVGGFLFGLGFIATGLAMWKSSGHVPARSPHAVA